LYVVNNSSKKSYSILSFHFDWSVTINYRLMPVKIPGEAKMFLLQEQNEKCNDAKISFICLAG
jgi:hypothetical protein